MASIVYKNSTLIRQHFKHQLKIRKFNISIGMMSWDISLQITI